MLLWSRLLDDYVWFVFWVLDGDGLLAGWDYDRATLFDRVGNRLWVKFLRGCTMSPSLSPNGELLAGFEGSTLYLYDLRSGEERYRVRVPGQPVASVSWVNGGEYLIVGQALGYVTLYRWSGDMIEEEWTKRVVEGIMAKFTSPFPSPSDKILLNSSSPHIYLVNLNGDIIWERRLDTEVMSAAFSPKGDYVAVITRDSLHILNVEDGEEACRLRVNPVLCSIVWVGKHIIVGDSEGYVNIYYWDDGKITPTNRFKAVEDIALEYGLSYNPKQHWLAVASTDKQQVRVYDIKTLLNTS